MQGSRNDLHRNAGGYNDPTAFAGINDIIKSDKETEDRASAVIKALKTIIRIGGFELIERIKIRDVKSGREFK